MRLKIGRRVLLLLFFSLFTLQLSQASLQITESITNYGAIAVPTRGVFFEYGAESGVLKPPFEIAGPVGSGSHEDSYVRASAEQAGSGTYSIKHYIRPPTQSDAQRRLDAREYSIFSEIEPSPTEFYFSWWRYFPDNIADADGPEGETSNQWLNTGGIGLRYGWPTRRTRYRGGITIGLTDPCSPKTHNHEGVSDIHGPRRFYIVRHELYGQSVDPYQNATTYYTDWYLDSSMVNKWLHFQIYFKLSNSSDGCWKVWFSDGTTEELVLDWSGATDPRSNLARWLNDDGNQCEFYYQPNGLYAKIMLYQPTPSPEHWAYADDVVLSYTKVP